MLRALSCLLLAAVLPAGAPPIAAHSGGPSETEPAASAALAARLAEWRAEHGPAWRVFAGDDVEHAEMLYGGRLPGAFVPTGDTGFAVLAVDVLEAVRGLTGVDPATLELDLVRFLPLGAIGSSDKTTVRFRQRAGGVEVVDGWTNVLFDQTGAALSVQTTAIPGLAPDFATAPAVSAEDARHRAVRQYVDRTGQPAREIEAPRLAIERRAESETEEPVLVWRVSVRTPGVAAAWTFGIDARTGALVSATDDVHHFDVSGTVTTLASPGVLPDISSNPEAVFPMSYVRVDSSNAGFVYADANGTFTFPGVSTANNVSISVRGQFGTTTNAAGTNYSVSLGNLSGSGNNVLLNPSPSQQTTAQANAYVSIYELRDWIRAIIPGDDTADFNAVAVTNLNQTCNAFFNGGSVNFFLAGGGCVNTAYSTIVSHEMGHWLNVRYGTGNGGDGMGEGNADVFAMYLDDTPLVGQNFSGGGSIRNGNNTRQFCGDCCPACYGQVHTDGQPWMGAAWKVRTNLKNALGAGAGSLAADTIFLSWMNAYNQGQIRSVIEVQWLTLDDDDGNILNGTPHFTPIDNGFRTQGFPGETIPVIAISEVTELGDTGDEVGPYAVEARIDANDNPPLVTAELVYRVNGGGWSSVAMAPQGGSVYRAEIPGQSALAAVDWYVRAADSAATQQLWPEAGAQGPRSFIVGTLDLLFRDRFTNDNGWTVTNQAVTSGAWERVNPVATGAAPGADYGPGSMCYVTENGSPGGSDGAADVDGGPTVLTSPPLDYNGFDGVIRYAYWMFNDDGDDSLIVQVSNNGGGSWVTAATYTGGNGGWTEAAFILSSFVTPSNDVRVRFSVSDNPNNSITEAAIDEFEALTLEDLPDPCVEPSIFCESLPNSTGFTATMVAVGSTSMAANDLRLVASPVPFGNNGLMVYSPTPLDRPVVLGNGMLCLSSQPQGFILRLPAETADVTNTLDHDFDHTAPPDPAGQVSVGSTWYFQCWFRDPDGGGALFSFSDGLRVTFCP